MARAHEGEPGGDGAGGSGDRPEALTETESGRFDSALVALAAAPPVQPRDRPPVLQRGAQIGRYVVVDHMGAGAMGEVARAYDPKLRREVAIKRLHVGLLDYEGEARLFREAQAMAQLSHPNVVSVFDVDRTDDGVIMAMELVDGIDMRTWLEARRPWREVLRHMTAAARALEAAHAAGLTHRDFKPANVMLVEQARRGHDAGVKVMDFGLARAAHDAADSQPDLPTAALTSAEDEDLLGSPITRAGSLMGTPAYMAPEQHDGATADARSDQFAFFVALWEGLWGALPYRGSSWVQLTVAKFDGPPAYPKGGVPRWVYEVAARGLAVDPADRFASMTEVVAALGRDPSIARRRGVVAVTAVALVAVAGVGGKTWLDARAQRCTGASDELADVWGADQRRRVRTAILGTGVPYAPQAWKRVAAGLETYAADWTAMHTAACEATTVRGEQSTALLDLRMACLQRAKLGLDATVDVLADADAAVVSKASAIVDGMADVDHCADVEALQTGVEPPDPKDAAAVATAWALVVRAEARTTAGRYAEAQANIDAAKTALAGVDYGPILTEVAAREGHLFDLVGKFDEAEVAWNRALELAAEGRDYKQMERAAMGLMGVVGFRKHQTDEALRYHTLARGLAKGHPLREAKIASVYGHILEQDGKYAEAEIVFREALAAFEQEVGPQDLGVATMRRNVAAALQEQGKHAQAQAEHRRALALREKIVGPHHPYVASSHLNIAISSYALGDFAEAEAGHRRALEIFIEVAGPDHPNVAIARNNLAMAVGAQGKDTEALAEYREAVRVLEKAFGPEHPYVGEGRSNVATVLSRLGRHEEAEAESREAVALKEKTQGRDHPDVAFVRHALAGILARQGKNDEAEAVFREALAVREEALGADHPHVAQSQTELAEVLLAQGRAGDAMALAERAWTSFQAGEASPEQRARSAFALARALWDTGNAADRQRARDLAGDSHQAYGDDDRGDEVRAWLDAHRAP